jgi:molybdopterin synthase catalytic subunit
MAISISEILITDLPLQSPGELRDPNSGAVIDFWGRVRGIEDGRELKGINYEAHRVMAEYQMNFLAKKASIKFSLTGLLLLHRVGFVSVGEASLFLRVASRHRADAFAASQWLIEELKRKVPIWKRPAFRDGDAVQVAKKQSKEVASI